MLSIQITLTFITTHRTYASSIQKFIFQDPSVAKNCSFPRIWHSIHTKRNGFMQLSWVYVMLGFSHHYCWWKKVVMNFSSPIYTSWTRFNANCFSFIIYNLKLFSLRRCFYFFIKWKRANITATLKIKIKSWKKKRLAQINRGRLITWNNNKW